ncbi:hypothetical protein [Plantibacter sp. YIM 135347]|uniref:hypothetical protein n=1 Tax=Plantibacter sp. YIM 135347 TaxID=3423919 RepID=UPI003D358D0B
MRLRRQSEREGRCPPCERRRPRSWCADDSGSTLVLTIGYAALALAVVLIVAAATSLYLERKRLLSLADTLSLVAAESFTLDEVVHDEEGTRPVLTDAGIERAVRDHLREFGAAPLRGVRIDEAASIDGRSARVTLSADWHPPLLAVFVPTGLRIDATSTARSVFW